MATTTSRIGLSARRAGRDSKFRGMARAGLAARGAIWILLGVLAVALALGKRSGETDQSGALQDLARDSAGWTLLLLLAIGLSCFALWQVVEAVKAGQQASRRLESAVTAVIYAGFAASAFSVVASGRTSSQAHRQQAWTARVMQHSGGRWAIGVAGVVVIVIGAVLFYRGVKRTFAEDLDQARMTAGTRKAVLVLGVAGSCARGVVVVMAGVLLITSAVQFDPNKARGVDGALRALRDTPAGPWLLGAVALGLVMYGLFGFCEARYRRL